MKLTQPGPGIERRRYPRVDKALRLQVHRGHEELATETINVSCGGALCRLDRPLPPMTKVAVALALPTRLVRCMAAVVRCRAVRRAEARARGRYQLALFFTDVSRRDHRAIAEFILESMLTHAHGRRRS